MMYDYLSSLKVTVYPRETSPPPTRRGRAQPPAAHSRHHHRQGEHSHTARQPQLKRPMLTLKGGGQRLGTVDPVPQLHTIPGSFEAVRLRPVLACQVFHIPSFCAGAAGRVAAVCAILGWGVGSPSCA